MKPVIRNNEPAPLTKGEAIKILTDMRKAVDPIAGNMTTIEALDCAIASIGICVACGGRGVEESAQMAGNGYQIRTGLNGRRIYLYPCKVCKGDKKLLSISCVSCGTQSEVIVTQLHATHCYKCEKKLMRTGVLR